MAQQHIFEGDLRWTGKAQQAGDKLTLERKYVIEFAGKAPLPGSSPASYKGDDSLHNPESLLVSSLMACHHLTFLALAERAGIGIAAYSDHAVGTLALRDGKMRMVEVVLHPRVVVADPALAARANALHPKAHAHCFISSSVNFEVRIEPSDAA